MTAKKTMAKKTMENRTTGAPRAFARRGMRAIATVVPKITGEAFRKRGFAEASIITDWAAIVGPRFATECSPMKLAFERGERSRGTLHLRVSGALAVELQHLAPELMDRINGYFGYRAVARLKFLQAAAHPHGPAQTQRPAETPAGPALSDDEAAALGEMVAGVPGEKLRAALKALGRAVIGRRPPRSREP